MFNSVDKCAYILRDILDRSNYIMIIKQLRGVYDAENPWYNYDEMKNLIIKINPPNRIIFDLFYLGLEVEYESLIQSITFNEINILMSSGIIEKNGDKVKTNGVVILTYQGLYITTEINSWYKNCKNKLTDTYIGPDSLYLAENIKFDKDAIVLDLCSGTGIQGMIAAKSAKKVISIEINPKAVNICRLNIFLNKLDKIIELRKGNLYNCLNNNEKFDYIYANPPFIPMAKYIEYPICGDGGEDGTVILKKITEGLNEYLKDNGEAIIFCECLGNDNNPLFNEYLKKLNNNEILAIYRNRITTGSQIYRVSKLLKLYDDAFNEDNFKSYMKKIYNELNCNFLYSVIYKIKKSDKTSFDILSFIHPWTPNSKAISNNIKVKSDNRKFKVEVDDLVVGCVDNEAKKFIELLNKGKTIQESAEIMFDEYGTKYESVDNLENELLLNAFKLETLGIIRRL